MLLVHPPGSSIHHSPLSTLPSPPSARRRFRSSRVSSSSLPPPPRRRRGCRCLSAPHLDITVMRQWTRWSLSGIGGGGVGGCQPLKLAAMRTKSGMEWCGRKEWAKRGNVWCERMERTRSEEEREREGEGDSGTSISKHKRTRIERCICGCVPTRRLNYPRLVLKLPPLLLWAATVIGLYRAICWLPR